jgi:hypothetical protein
MEDWVYDRAPSLPPRSPLEATPSLVRRRFRGQYLREYSEISLFFDAEGKIVGDSDGADSCGGTGNPEPCGGCGCCLTAQALYSGLVGVLACQTEAAFVREWSRAYRHDLTFMDRKFRICTVCSLQSAGVKKVRAHWIAQSGDRMQWFECGEHGPADHARACGEEPDADNLRVGVVSWQLFQERLVGSIVASRLTGLSEGNFPLCLPLSTSCKT